PSRGDRLQVGWTIPFGAYQEVKAEGVEALKAQMLRVCPMLAPALDGLHDWDQIFLLPFMVERAVRWYTPGLLLIGDAAHVMPPIGGQGINVALADAAAAADEFLPVLGEAARAGAPPAPDDLDRAAVRVELRRAPVARRVMQLQATILHLL